MKSILAYIFSSLSKRIWKIPQQIAIGIYVVFSIKAAPETSTNLWWQVMTLVPFVIFLKMPYTSNTENTEAWQFLNDSLFTIPFGEWRPCLQIMYITFGGH